MKFSITLLMLCLSLAVFSGEQIQSDLHQPLQREKIGLKGSVHRIKIEHHVVTQLDERVIEDLKFVTEEAVFNVQGQMIEFKNYPQMGILRRWSRYEYTEKILRRSESDFYDKEGQLYRKSEYEYDELVGVRRQINFDYDEKEKIFRRTEITREAPDGAVNIKEYKADGKPMKRNFLNTPLTQSGRLPKKDEGGQQEQKKLLPVNQRSTYDEIDSHGNWTKMSSPREVRISNGQRLEIQETFIRTITYY